MEESHMKNVILATTAIITLSATSVFANEISFVQNDTVGLSNINFEQAGSGIGNVINLITSGDVTSVSIVQSDGGEVSESSGNVANVTLLMNSTVTQFDGSDGATREDGWKTFNATLAGDDNVLSFVLGATADAAKFGDVDVDIEVTGDDNDLSHTVANGLAADSLQFSGTVDGDSNYVLATIGAAGSIEYNYDIIGDNNSYTSTIAGPASGGRTVDVSLTGDSNVWTVTANAAAGILNVNSTGDSVTGTHTQTGASSELLMDINKSGSAAFAVTTTQTGAASANVTINADGGGAFTLTQTGALASYTGTLNISAGGAVTITQ
jgi:hypothetical protein